jgi:hypothetical protein
MDIIKVLLAIMELLCLRLKTIGIFIVKMQMLRMITSSLKRKMSKLLKVGKLGFLEII